MRRWLAAFAAAAFVLALPALAHAGTVERSEASGRNVRVFVPTKPAAKPAAILMLAGCSQKVDDLASATRMDDVAEENGFYTITIEEPTSIIASGCFQWWEPKHQARGAGEPKELSDAAMAVVAAKNVDPERVYVAGLSAGAAMAVVLGATYPDRFAALGVVAGLPYKAATTAGEAYSVMQDGNVDGTALGDLAKTAMGTQARVVPTLIFHGSADGVVDVKNGQGVEAQWVRTNGALLAGDTLAAPKTVTGTANGYKTTTTVHRATSNNATVVELVLVDNLGHAWPGGLAGGSFADAKGPDASRALWAFFAPRTRSAPLPAEAADAIPGATSSGDPGSSGTPSDGTPSDGSSPSSSGGGSTSTTTSSCAVSHGGTGATAGFLAIAATLFALARRRRTR